MNDIYISASEVKYAARIDDAELSRLHKSNLIGYRLVDGKGPDIEYRLSDLSFEARKRHMDALPNNTFSLSDEDLRIYSSAPDYARKKADKYLQVIHSVKNATGADLMDHVKKWNANHPEFQTSYASITRIRREFAASGVHALLGNYGKQNSSSIVPDDLFEYFKSIYLSDGRPSSQSCWKITLGYAHEKGIETSSFPSHQAFFRRLKNEIPEHAVYMAREGESAANRRYGYFVKRDYSDIYAGQCWVSDHAQIDVACEYYKGAKKLVGYPWITAWRDLKSGLFVTWDIHMDSPDSDDIFYSFYLGGLQYCLPNELILDNGKDFRCKDFAGGRKTIKVPADVPKTTSLTAALGITTHFAWPYNAQTKPIERDFLRIKEWFSKLAVGYRGGDVVERPEAHNDTISSGKIMPFEELNTRLSSFISDVLNRGVISSGHRAGKSPLEIWNTEYPIAVESCKLRKVTRSALMLFCTRTSSVVKIDRRGVHDSQFDVDYYEPWMAGQHGRKVYLRRDPRDMREAWVFDADKNEFIGNATLNSVVSAIAISAVSKDALKDQIVIKKQANRVAKAFATDKINIPFDDKQRLLAEATKLIDKKRGFDPDLTISFNPTTIITDMDRVKLESDRLKNAGTQDLSKIVSVYEPPAKRKLIVFESEKEQYGKVAAG
jgi:putative transposase